MGGRKGYYEYRYEFRFDNEVIPAYESTIAWNMTGNTPEPKMYLFDFTTTLKLKCVDDSKERVMGTERFGVWMERDYRERQFLEACIRYRVSEDYSMAGDHIQSMVRAALEFAKQAEPDFITAADLSEEPGGEITLHWRIPVRAVVVALEVVTVQQEGESIRESYQA